MPPQLTYALVMLAAGIGIPVLAALNAQLGQRLGSPSVAAAILFVVAFSCAAIVALGAVLARGPSILSGALSQPRHLYLAGTFVAFYVLTITWIAPRFGVGNAIFFVLLGQLVSAAVIDQWGLLGARQAPLTLVRGSGLLLMAAGLVLTQKG